jgi:hypothetical protein
MRGAVARLERGDERVEPSFGLALEEVIGVGERPGARGRSRAARDGALPEPARTHEHLAHRSRLDEHPGDEHRIRPADLVVGERLDVQIADADLPARRQVRRERGEPERRERRPLPDEGEAVLVTPVRGRRRRLDEEHAHNPRGLSPHRHERVTAG